MKYLEGFRNPAAAAALRREISRRAAELERHRGAIRIMEVCGTHTMAIARYGIRDLLPGNVELISGPGCPVCVTPAGYVDAAIELARRGIVVATFGDMLPVPGTRATLAECRAAGATVEVCYSPLRALERAAEQSGREVVFLAIGFETTVAPVLSVLERARRLGVRNLSLLTAFKMVPPALQALVAEPDLRIDAFLCPAHVSAIIGSDAYRPLAAEHGRPCVVAGFEPLDILYGLQGILEQLLRGVAVVENQYAWVVKPEGNPRARGVIERFTQPVVAEWRGLGVLPDSGLGLRPEYADGDAERRYGITVAAGAENPGCRCGEVLTGRIRPPDCGLFADACTPDNPVGPCMVSAEGTCAAYFKYLRRQAAT